MSIELELRHTMESCPQCGSPDIRASADKADTWICDLCKVEFNFEELTELDSRPAFNGQGTMPEATTTVPPLKAPTITGWWALSSVELARALRRVAEGETPEAVYFSLVENAEVPGP